jgi:hypothetical protein
MANKIIYSFKYESENTLLRINRKLIEIQFKSDYGSLVYINRIDYTKNITIGSPVLELLTNGDYLTSDGIQININGSNLTTQITYLEDGSYLESRGDGSIELQNNGILNFFDDDRDLKLSPNVYKKRLFLSDFVDNYSFSHLSYIRLTNNSTVSGIINTNVVSFGEEKSFGEVMGINNQYNIVRDSSGSTEDYLIPFVPDYNRNNLSEMFV